MAHPHTNGYIKAMVAHVTALLEYFYNTNFLSFNLIFTEAAAMILCYCLNCYPLMAMQVNTLQHNNKSAQKHSS